jgi:hypothetical protein
MIDKRSKTLERPTPVRTADCLEWARSNVGVAIALLECLPQTMKIDPPSKLLKSMVGNGGCNFEPGGCETRIARLVTLGDVVRILTAEVAYLGEIKKTV